MKDLPTTALDALDDPDVVGASEYRAIYDCLTDAEAEDPDLAVGMLEEFLAYAEAMIDRITGRDETPVEAAAPAGDCINVVIKFDRALKADPVDTTNAFADQLAGVLTGKVASTPATTWGVGRARVIGAAPGPYLSPLARWLLANAVNAHRVKVMTHAPERTNGGELEAACKALARFAAVHTGDA